MWCGWACSLPPAISTSTRRGCRKGRPGAHRAGDTALDTSAAARQALLDQHCVGCHNQRVKTAGLMLDTLDLEHLGQSPETWEKVAHMLRTGAMPRPVGRGPTARRRPSGHVPRRRARSGRGCRTVKRRPHTAASAEPNRVRECRSRPSRARDSVLAAAGRQLNPGLRQHRGIPDGVAVVARALYVSRAAGQPARGWRHHHDGGAVDISD